MSWDSWECEKGREVLSRAEKLASRVNEGLWTANQKSLRTGIWPIHASLAELD